MSEPIQPAVSVERRSPRWMRAVLVISLALNLLTIGIIASAAWHLHDGVGRGPGMIGRLHSFVDTLPAERAEKLRAVIREARPAIQPLRREIWRARREVANLFEASQFDRDQYAAAHQRVLDAEIAMRREQFAFMSSLAAAMTAEERQEFAKLRRPPPRRGGGEEVGEKEAADPAAGR